MWPKKEKELGLELAVVEKVFRDTNTMLKKFQPGFFVKIMSDGFFRYPSNLLFERDHINQRIEGYSTIELTLIAAPMKLSRKFSCSSFPWRDCFFSQIFFSPISYLNAGSVRTNPWRPSDCRLYQGRSRETLAHVLMIAGVSLLLSRRLIQEAIGWIYQPSRSKDERGQMKNTARLLNRAARRPVAADVKLEASISFISVVLKGPARSGTLQAIIQLKSLTGRPIMKALA